MPLTLAQFLARLDQYHDRIPLDVLDRGMRELAMSLDDVREYVRFGPTTYRRNLFHEGPAYQALILCWRAGQRSPIHDHGESSCGVRVLSGCATETVFERTARGHIFPTSTRAQHCGGICATQDDDIHQISNLADDGTDLITLHIYSPALLRMRTYSMTNTDVNEFFDPVYEMCEGAGI